MSEIDNRRRRANVKFVQSLKDKPRMDCGVRYHMEVMEFDHVRGEKLFNLSQPKHRSKDTILYEVSKCDLVCANCHRMRTYKRRISNDGVSRTKERLLF